MLECLNIKNVTIKKSHWTLVYCLFNFIFIICANTASKSIVNEVPNCLVLKAVFFYSSKSKRPCCVQANVTWGPQILLGFLFYLNSIFLWFVSLAFFRTSSALYRECTRTSSSLEFTTRAWHCISNNKEISNSRHGESVQWYVIYFLNLVILHGNMRIEEYEDGSCFQWSKVSQKN